MNEVKQQIVINNIDKNSPQIIIEYIEMNNTIKVVVKSNEELQEIDGWEIANNKKIMSKIYSVNQEEEITFLDLAGNEIKKTIKIDSIRDLDNNNTDKDDKEDEYKEEIDTSKGDKTDSTIVDIIIPNAGKNHIIAIMVVSIIIGIISYCKIKKYKDIN